MIPLREIHQIEMTSHCDLACKYCPSRKLPRPKLHMSREHYVKALGWARTFALKHGGSHGLNLAGIGESTLHPDFVEFVHLAREAVGPYVSLVLATNGVSMTRELAEAIAPTKIKMFVSLHRPEKAGPAIEHLRAAGIFAGSSSDPSLAATDWAGQVKWHNSVPVKRDCMWVRNGLAFVLADGRVSRCAYDASGKGVFAHVDDDLTKFSTSPWSLCRTCDQDVGYPIPEETSVHAAA